MSRNTRWCKSRPLCGVHFYVIFILHVIWCCRQVSEGCSSVCFSLHGSSTADIRTRRVCIAVAVLTGGAGKHLLWQQLWEWKHFQTHLHRIPFLNLILLAHQIVFKRDFLFQEWCIRPEIKAHTHKNPNKVLNVCGVYSAEMHVVSAGWLLSLSQPLMSLNEQCGFPVRTFRDSAVAQAVSARPQQPTATRSLSFVPYSEPLKSVAERPLGNSSSALL